MIDSHTFKNLRAKKGCAKMKKDYITKLRTLELDLGHLIIRDAVRGQNTSVEVCYIKEEIQKLEDRLLGIVIQ